MLKNVVTLKSGPGSLKVIGTDTYRSVTDDFLLTFDSNHGPISFRFRDKRRFQCLRLLRAVVRQSQNFRPAADPLPGDAGRPKFNHLEMVITFTYIPVW